MHDSGTTILKRDALGRVGYSAYTSFAKQRALTGKPIQLAGCMAHVRRKFFEAKAEGEDPAWFLLQIQNLYRIETRLRDCRAGPDTIGKKNWLFVGDPKSGDRAAAFYTLIGNCHRAGIDAQAYLTDLFTRLPLPTETTKTIRGLTPQGWAAAQKAAAETRQA